MGVECRFLMVVAGLIALINQSSMTYARSYVDIVSTSIVYPFAENVAGTIENRTGFARPRIAVAETHDVLADFCSGNGMQYPDIAGTSRRVRGEEIERCIKNGVADVIEIPIGYTAIALVRARSAPVFSLDVSEIYLATIKQTPEFARQAFSAANRMKRWSEINGLLPDISINFVGPPKDTDLRYAFEQLVMLKGCVAINSHAAHLKERKGDLNYLEQLTLQGLCSQIREDGHYRNVDDVSSLIDQLRLDFGKIGILEYHSLQDQAENLQPLPINGILPSTETISSGQYPLAQPLFLYVKKAHLDQVPGLWPYLAFFTSEGQMGPAGALAKNGLIALPADERSYAKSDLKAQKTSQLLAVIK